MAAYTITATCAGETATVVVTVPRLPTPANLMVDTVSADPPTDSSFSVRWDAVAGATGYTATAQASDGSGPEWPGTVDDSGDPVKASFSSLMADTEYTVTVIALGDGTTLDSAPATLTVATTTVPQTATITLSGDGRIMGMVHAGTTPYMLTMKVPAGAPSPPVPFDVTGPDDFSFSGTADASAALEVTAPADGDYTVTDPATGESDTFTIPTTVPADTQLGGIRIGYWIRAESATTSQFDVGFSATGIDPAADPTPGTITPGSAMQWRALDGQTPEITFTDPDGTPTVATIAAGDLAQSVEISYSPAGG